MKTMSFETNNSYRVMENSELVYTLTNSEHLMYQTKQAEMMKENFSLSEVLAQLTPARQKVALAAIELYRRSQAVEPSQIRSSQDLYMLMRTYLENLETEEFWCVFVNQSSKVIRKVRVSLGGINTTVVDVRVIMKQALMCNAVALFVCHNHPSENTRPSIQDNQITQEIKKAGAFMAIRLIDHIIIGKNGFYSYADEGIL